MPYEQEAYESFFKAYYRFKIKGYRDALGYIPEKVVRAFQWPNCWAIDDQKRTLSLAECNDIDERTSLFSSTLKELHRSGASSKLDAPMGEMLPIYGPGGKHILDIDRAAAILFGTVSYGLQMLAYTKTEQGLRYWVPRRAKNKRSYPGMLDNCVGGALNTGETPLTCLVREASEEASLPEEYVRQHAIPYGVVSYHMATDGNGEEGHQPQVMHVYHIELAPDLIPTPSDGEVEKFELMTLEAVQTALMDSEFKTNCAATWLSYLIATRVINAENEPNLYGIMSHLHRRLQFPAMGVE